MMRQAERSVESEVDYAMEMMSLPTDIAYKQEAVEYQRHLRQKPTAPGEKIYDRLGPDGRMHRYSRQYDFTQGRYVDEDLGFAKAPVIDEEPSAMRQKGDAVLN